MPSTLFMQLFILANAVVLGVVITLAVQYGRAHLSRKKNSLPAALVEASAPKPAFDPAVKQKMLHDAEVTFQGILEKSIGSLEADLTATTAKLRTQLERFGHDAENEEAERYHKTIDELHDEAKNILASAQSAIAQHQTDLTNKLIERQADLERELVDNIGQLEQELVKRQAELQAELNERQAELEARLAKHHAELRTGFNERQEKIEAELTRHQTELESALTERQVSLAKIQTELDTTLAARREQLETELAAEMQKKRDFLTRQLDTKLTDAVSSFLLEALGHHIDLGAQAPYLTALLEEHKAELVNGMERRDG